MRTAETSSRHGSYLRRFLVSILTGLCTLSLSAAAISQQAPAREASRQGVLGQAAPPGSEFTVDLEPGSRIAVRWQDEPFTEYHFGKKLSGEDTQHGHVPYFYPVYGPGGVAMTRNWPMAEAPGEQQDHPHHRSLWFAHGDVNGHDFWTGGDGSRIEQDEVRSLSGGREATIETTNTWWTVDRERIATDTRRWTLRAGDGWRSIDLDIEIRPTTGELRFGDTKEGTMALRVAPQLRLEGEVATGHIRNSEGQRDGECWGKRARWVDYSGRIADQEVGVAMFDHPDNPRHPTWWHARGYGLVAANPFGIHDFEKEPDGTGDLVIGQGESLRLRYRIVLYEGTWTQERLEETFLQMR